MKKIFILASIGITIFSCTNNSKEEKVADNRIALRTDTINIVKLTDTLVIFESTCGGCEYERSTNFAISDSMNMIRLADVVTTNNNPVDMDGGSISKDLILVPLKTGTTNIKVYKFWTLEKTTKDSSNFISYKIEVKQ